MSEEMLVARAICQAEAKRHYGIDRGADEAWTAATDYARSEWLADAKAALSAYNPNERLTTLIDDELFDASTSPPAGKSIAYFEAWQEGYDAALNRVKERLSALSPLPQGEDASECPECQGRGDRWIPAEGLPRAPYPAQCDYCHGTGKMAASDEDIPALEGE